MGAAGGPQKSQSAALPRQSGAPTKALSSGSQPAVIDVGASSVPESFSGELELLLQASGSETTAIATSSQNIPLRFMVTCSTV